MSRFCDYCGDEIEETEDVYRVSDRAGLVAYICRLCNAAESDAVLDRQTQEMK